MFRHPTAAPLALTLGVWLATAATVPAQAPAEPGVRRALPVDDTETPAVPPSDKPADHGPTAPAKAKHPAPTHPAAPQRDEDIPEGKPVPKEAAAIVPKAEEIPEGKAVSQLPSAAKPGTAKAKDEPPLQASMRTQADARTLYITLPAPRGLIVDRNGLPIAQNIVAYYPGVQFPEGAAMKPADALAYAKQRIAIASKVLAFEWQPKDEDIIEHYTNRRWLPFLADRAFKQAPTEEQIRHLLAGTILHPAYLRTYPHGRTACHFLGSVGKVRPMPLGPLDPLDPFYPEMIGRDGLEQAYEEHLKGKAGQMNMLFDAKGNKIAEEITQHPTPGNTIVTTLDLDFQQICEDVLRESVKRGAFVIVDVMTGDVVAMASWPMFDLNDWVPSIAKADFDKLMGNKEKPLRGRAFMDVYPPASTFKVVTALAGLDAGKLSEDTTYDCNPSLQIGNRVFHNWSRQDFGPLDMIGAIKYSCNTWFYRAGMATGSKNLVSMANRLGYGERTGLPIRGEAPGRVANDEWMQQNHGRPIGQGDLANMSIGQGPVSATPVQVARAMAAIGNGDFVPNLRLVSQVQDINNKVLESFPPTHRNELNVKRDYLRSVQKGMTAVVNDSGGTGQAASCKYVKVAGKTGTAQWGPDRHMAWFAGFLPAKDPQYAFAAVYEGDVGEDNISGGKKVAPMVSDVFNRVYKLKKDRDEPFYRRRGPVLAKSGEESKNDEGGDESGEEGDEKPHERKPAKADTKPVAKAEPAPAPAPPRDSGVRGFFKRLFSRR